MQAEKLRALGIEVEEIGKPFTATVEKYMVTGYKKATKEWEKIYPVTVSTRMIKEKKSFPAGCFIIRLSQKNANLAATLLEPESISRCFIQSWGKNYRYTGKTKELLIDRESS